MTTESKTAGSKMTVQEHCIDLPGETVQCWIGGGTDKLKVILRKHRDVIFDIHLGDGKTYTLETTESDFYNVRDKKLVSVADHGKVTFKDRERMHVWVSRGFQGALVLKLEGRPIYRVVPSEWDEQRYGDDPKEKPAPIIVAVGAATLSQSASRKNLADGAPTSPALSHAATAATDNGSTQACGSPVVCVIDGKVEGMPSDLVEYFEKGGGNTGFADIDPYNIATRNWIWGQIVGTAAYVGDNWEWLRASLDGKTSEGFKFVSAKVHYVRGKVRIYFSGYSNSNRVFGRGGFGSSHERIMTIFSGAGKTASAFNSAAKGVAATFKGYALVSFIFGTATSLLEWKDDIHKDGYDLAATLITGAIKTIIATGLATLATAAIVWAVMIGLGATLPLIVVGIITVGVGIYLGNRVEAADRLLGRVLTHDPSNNDGVAAIAASWLRETGHSIEEKVSENWHYLMHKMSSDYQEIVF